MSEVKEKFHSIEARVKHSALKYSVIAASALTALFLKDTPGVRNNLPEPIDIPDHLGNINVSLQLGYAGGLVAGKMYTHFEEFSEPEEAERKTRAVMALAGFCVGMVLNVAAETKFGQSVVPLELGTPDTVDLVYGVTAATVAAAVGPSLQTSCQDVKLGTGDWSHGGWD